MLYMNVLLPSENRGELIYVYVGILVKKLYYWTLIFL